MEIFKLLIFDFISQLENLSALLAFNVCLFLDIRNETVRVLL